MIINFKDEQAQALFKGERAKKLPTEIQKAARRKLAYLHAAEELDDLRVPAGNHLEALKGDLAGLHSIRINKQWRIVFRWHGGSEGVRIVDYH